MEKSKKDKKPSYTEFETIDINGYDNKMAVQSTLESLFPFTKSGRESLYGTLAFIFAAFFCAGPGVISILAFILPRKTFLNYIASQTETFFQGAAMLAIAVTAWFLLGRIIDCVRNKKTFLPYASFKDVLKKNPVRILFIVLLILMTIACLLSEKVENAFTNPTDGAITWYLVALGVMIVSLIKDKNQIRILLTVFVAASVLTCGVMFVQYTTIYCKLKLDSVSDFFALWSVDFTKIDLKGANLAELRGVFSNSNHYGYYLAMSSLAAAGLYISGDRWWKRVLSALAFVVLMFTMVTNDTLGAQLAIIVSVLLLPLFFAWSKTSIPRRFAPMVIMVCVFVFMSLYPQLPIGSNNIRKSINEITSSLKKLAYSAPAGEEKMLKAGTEGRTVTLGGASESSARYARLSEDSDENRWWLEHQEIGTNRLGLWQYGIHLISKKPIFGYGINGSKEYFQNDSGLKVPASRVHNEYLQIGIDLGIPAMLVHIAAYIGVAVYFFSKLKKEELTIVQRILFGMLFAYAVSALTGICAYYTASYFYVLLGLLISTFEGSFHEYPQSNKLPSPESLPDSDDKDNSDDDKAQSGMQPID